MIEFHIGERVSIPEDGIYGVISSIEPDDYGEPASLVIECDDGKWAAVPIDSIEPIAVTVH